MNRIASTNRINDRNTIGALLRLSFHNSWTSSPCIFFIAIDLRNGEIIATVSTPHIPFAHQCNSGPIPLLINGKKNVNIRNITAIERMEYTTILTIMECKNFFQSPPAEDRNGELVVILFTQSSHAFGNIRSMPP